MLAGFFLLVAQWPAAPVLGWSSGMPYPIGGVASRITALEHGRSVTSTTIWAVFMTGIIGIAANYGLSHWRTKFVARQVIRQRLRGFDVRLRERILDAMQASDDQLRRHEERVQDLTATLDEQLGSLRDALKDGKGEVSREQRDAVRHVGKHGKELAGALKKEFRNATKTIA
jgi:hypothetical protein